MKKGLTEIVFILDRSGSMGGLEADTIGGYNSMIAKQKEEEGEALVSTVLFDNETEVLHDRIPLDKISPITDKEYYVRGSTALLDAVGGAIHHIGNVHKYARPEDVPEKTLFIITTDGMENSSRQYSYEKVKKMVERQKEKYHWEFIFLGANIDAVSVAGKFGVDSSRAVRYECDSAGTALNYKVMNKMVGCARAAASAAEMEAAFDSDEMLSEIRKDYEKRHRK
ncbi:MAG: VWA domain-containing protein [Lachnospiraceae bacterium]|nr:VWA domain-containing protein [Lachnospiraceae bacterium]